METRVHFWEAFASSTFRDGLVSCSAFPLKSFHARLIYKICNYGTFPVADSDFGQLQRTRTLCASPEHELVSSRETVSPILKHQRNSKSILTLALRFGSMRASPPPPRITPSADSTNVSAVHLPCAHTGRAS